MRAEPAEEAILNAWWIILLVFLAGCVGGLANAIIAGELHLPHTDNEARIYRPGWMGTVLVGGIAAMVFWGLYGPMAAAVLVGPSSPVAVVPSLRVSELFAALLTGIGGGRLLTAEVERRFARKETDALAETKVALIDAVEELSGHVQDREP